MSTATATSICSSASRQGSPIASTATTTGRSSDVAGSGGRCRSDGHTRRGLGRLRRATATSISTSASRADRKRTTKLYRNDGAGKPSRTSPRRSAWMPIGETRQVSFDRRRQRRRPRSLRRHARCAEPAVPQRRRPVHQRRQGTRARRSATHGRRRVVRCRRRTAISISSSPTRTATPAGCFANDRRAVRRRRHAERRMDAPGRPETVRQQRSERRRRRWRRPIWICSSPATARNFSTATTAADVFTEVAAALRLAGGDKATPSRWGDFDNDGRPDLYVSSYVDTATNEHDFLYHHDGRRARPKFAARAGVAQAAARRDARRPVGGLRRRRRSRSLARQQQPDRRASALPESAAAGAGGAIGRSDGPRSRRDTRRERARKCGSMREARAKCWASA